jgi:hypothetical protein
MPGWYVHMEAAKVAAKRLDAEDVPETLGFRPGEAKAYGETAHKWRNYFAIGALGPDLFYLLPDFKKEAGNVLLSAAKWVLDEWDVIDKMFVGSWEKWMGPVGANDADLTAQLTGGLSNQLGQAMDEISAAEFNAIVSLASRLGDWFGLLTSGVPQGLADSGFYWSDMFHYRRTYDFPRVLSRMANEHLAAALQMESDLTAGGRVPSDDEKIKVEDAKADAESELAFALGWITHCATDVTGHPFTNAKCGGPYRLHWQRHHLVENHMDAAAYDMGHMGDSLYEELGTSALHFRIAFRTRADAPYNGRHDAPAYDYFSGFPAYPLGETAIDDEKRTRFFDMDPGELPHHLVELIIAAMKEVYGSDPSVLVDAPNFSDGGPASPTGRPNADALNVMWDVAFRYLKYISSAGLHPRKPMPPSVINEHSFPTPPGGALPAEDDGRGGDPDDDTNPQGQSFNVIDFLISLLAWIKYVGQVVEWLVTVLPGLGLDVATFPAREFLYYAVVSPLYSLYMASRKLLVLEAFLVPKPEEIEAGLVTLGFQTGHQRQTLSADLNHPTGFAPIAATFDEPSGTSKPNDEWEVDMAFPRSSMTDSTQHINQSLSPFGVSLLPSSDPPYSHWVMPWKYPDTNLNGDRIGWEPHLAHAGPMAQGAVATDLFARADTDLTAAARFEQASTPEETSLACHDLFPSGAHLGHPVDYSLYLLNRLVGGIEVSSFNLDSDRGYGFRCWDYDRHNRSRRVPPRSVEDFHCWEPAGVKRFAMEQPCTVPEQYNPAWSANDPASVPPPGPQDPRNIVNRYRPMVGLRIHYLDPGGGQDGCTNLTSTIDIPEATTAEQDQASMNPDGSERPHA